MGNAAEDGNATDHFKRLFGNATEGRPPLFSDENPFHRKQDEGSGADFDGISHYGKKETHTEKGEVFEESKNKIKNDKGIKKLRRGNDGTEILGGDSVLLAKSKKFVAESDEDLDMGKRKKRKKKDSASDEVTDGIGNDEFTNRKKKKTKEFESSRSSGQRKTKTEDEGQNVDILGIRVKKQKSYSRNGEDLDIRKEEIVRGIEEACADDDSLPRKKKKMKEAKNIKNSGQRKIKTEDEGQGVESLDISLNKSNFCDEVGIRKEGVVRGIEEVCTSKNDFTRKKKKMKMKEFVERSSLGEGNTGLSEEERNNLRHKVEAGNGNDGLLGTKRKDYVSEDVALSRMNKKRRIAMDENVQSATEGESHLLEEKVRTNNRKRASEDDKNEPSKRVKVDQQYREGSKVAAGPGPSVVSKFEVKSPLGKRKRDDIEEGYEARNGVGNGETLLKEGGDPKKVTGKRKWGDEAADMVVKKDSFDDGEKLERTVFVGNLPSNLKRKKLIREFSQFGEVESVRLRSIPIVDTKLSRKGAVLTGKINESINSVHAYIVFKDAHSANAALSYNMAEIGGNHIRVDRAHPPCKKLKGENHFIYDIKRTIFVGNLPFDVMDEELYQLFAGIEQLESSVEAIRVIRDSLTSMGKGIAYVLFKTVDASKLAVKKKNLKLRDRSLRISMVRPNSNTQPQREPNSRSKYTPIAKSFGRKRWTHSEETSNITLVKKSKISLSYQGTKASKTVKHSTKLMGSNQQDTDSKPREFKRPGVAARKASSLKSPQQNPAGIKRKWEGKRTGYSKSPKKIRVN